MYANNADVPNRFSLFFDQAYHCLFQTHDALSKGGFKRIHLAKLDIQQFEKVFSLLCLQSYDKREFYFTRNKAINYVETAKQLTQYDFKCEDFIEDAIVSVNLLYDDGLNLSYIHRSFQEYFVAKFIISCNTRLQRQLIERYSRNVLTDNVIKLLFQMDQEMVEKNYLLPLLSKLIDNWTSGET